MKHLFFILLLVFICNTEHATAQKEGDKLVWYTDILKAWEKSKETNRPIFALFTGSDWCVWCHKLENEVFDKMAFKKWAEKNVVLVELDFPRHKELAPELVQQNNNLQQAFQVQGFPTVWMFFLNKDTVNNKMNITALGSLGYPSGAIPGKEELKFIENANAVLAKRTDVKSTH
jgi:thioredoxin-related protein